MKRIGNKGTTLLESCKAASQAVGKQGTTLLEMLVVFILIGIAVVLISQLVFGLQRTIARATHVNSQLQASIIAAQSCQRTCETRPGNGYGDRNHEHTEE